MSRSLMKDALDNHNKALLYALLESFRRLEEIKYRFRVYVAVFFRAKRGV